MPVAITAPYTANVESKTDLTEGRARKIARWLLGVAYMIAGIAHVTSPGGFVKITPAWVPYPHEVVLLTGLCECAGAIALLFIPRLRRAAGWAFAAYAICVYPANVNHAINNIAVGGAPLGWWYHGPRLLLQPVIVWWALWGTQIVDWPFRTRYAPDR